MEYFLLLLGFALLIISGRILIHNAVAIAHRLRLSDFVIGLTVVAAGTSAPELLVSLTGALKGHADVAVYNVVGSNISNILLVLAVVSVILPLRVRKQTLRIDWPVMMTIGVLAALFILDMNLSAGEGIMLLVFLAAFLSYSVIRSTGRNAPENNRAGAPGRSLPAALIMVALSSWGLAYGADMLVDNAVTLAQHFNISERIISVSLLAVGTSIPELTASVIAAFRKETDISVGNILGSNIFNIGMVLGITSMVHPLEVNPMILSFDIFWFLGAGLLLLFMLLVPQKLELQRWKGMVMLSVYLIYLYFVLGSINY